MDKQQAFDLLADEFNLKPVDYYFLDLIPLIEMIWADGYNQKSELSLLYKFTIEHIAHLDRIAGIPFASIEDANDFLDRFAHQRPPKQLLTKLREWVVTSLEAGDSSGRQQNILGYCLDIAAACATQYPFGLQERVVESEKELLNKLFSALSHSTEQSI